MRHVSFDIETYSSVDIGSSGSYKYALSDDFEILLIAYAVDDGAVRCIDLTKMEFDDADMLDEFIELLYAEDTVLHAYNASFEFWCMNQWLPKHGYEKLPVSKYRCTMIHGLYCGYTAGLGVTGDVLGLPQDKKKMTVGKALIRKFCVPQKKEPVRVTWREEPEKWELFKSYCVNDVEAEREIERRLSDRPVPEREQKLWELDITSNAFGVGIDMSLVEGALAIRDGINDDLLNEAKRITGLENPMSVSQLSEWINGKLESKTVTNLRKATVIDMLDEGVDDADVARVLRIRQQLGKTSTKKYDAIVECACADNRVRGVTQYYGANRTGRYSGRLIQTQNLPQNHLDDIASIREIVRAKDRDCMEMLYGEGTIDALSQLIRTVLVPKQGYGYAIADYSAIEARTIAWIAGERWVLDVFRNNGDIYCATASQMFGVPVEKHGQNSELRQKGKIATLALGYGGGAGALTAMGALKMGLKEEELDDIKQLWRKANPHIVRLWYEVGDAAETCIRESRPVFLKHGITFRYEQFMNGQNAMTIELPAGRKLYYAEPHFKPAPRFPDRLSLHYYGVNQQTKKWEEVDTHGGKLVENITQAIARDILCETLMKLYTEKGYTPTFHVHDEVIIESEDREAALKDLLDIMGTTPEWADGLPLKGAGFTTPFYMKD